MGFLKKLWKKLRRGSSVKYIEDDGSSIDEEADSRPSIGDINYRGNASSPAPKRAPYDDSRASSDQGSRGLIRQFQAIKQTRSVAEAGEYEEQNVDSKTEEEKEEIIVAIKDNVLFADYSQRFLQKVVLPMRKVVFEAGSVIIQQGDENADDFYVCVEGTCEVIKCDTGGEEILRFKYKHLPQAFGELALLYQAPRAASVLAASRVVCWVLNYQDFTNTLRREEIRDQEEKHALMVASKVFEGLDLDHMNVAADALELVGFPRGETILRAGQNAESLYIISDGQVTFRAPNGKKTILKRGDAFGRLSPWESESLEIVATSDLMCYMLDDGGCRSLVETLQAARIFDSLSKVPLLMSIGKEQLMELTTRFTRVEFQKGQYVIREGEVGDAFFVVESGSYRVMHNGKSLLPNDIGIGQCFGEGALLHGQSNIRQADVVTVETGICMRLAKADFVEHLGHLDDVKNMWRMVALRKTKLLRNLEHNSMLQVAKALSREVFHEGQTVIKQGDIGDKFYIIEMGTCEVINSSGKVLNTMEAGMPFGEAALLTASKRTATVKVTSAQCYLLSLNRGDFYSLLGGLMDKLKEAAAQYISDTMDVDIFNPKEVKWIKPFGAGAYAIVYLGWWKGQLYAIKAINKKHMIDIKQVTEVIAEKNMMQDLHNNFCIQLAAKAQDSRNLYMMMPPVLGGELFSLVADKLGPLTEDHARFYAACTVLGIEYLHSNNILYRDLKLENLLLDGRGYLRVADLGIAKRLRPGEKTYTFKGTPDYMAPEYLNSGGVSHSADWWALGVLIFEMVAGYTPFQADEPMEMFRKITNVQYQTPNAFSSQLNSLMSGLLEKRVSRRLGSGVTGAAEIKQHPWFKGVDWAALKDKRLEAPYVPRVDLDEYTEVPGVEDHPVTKGQCIKDEEQVLFEGF